MNFSTLPKGCDWSPIYHSAISGRRWWQNDYWLPEFESWTRQFAFHIALIPLGKLWILLFSLNLRGNYGENCCFFLKLSAILKQTKWWFEMFLLQYERPCIVLVKPKDNWLQKRQSHLTQFCVLYQQKFLLLRNILHHNSSVN